jgi:hypothetical protein
MTKGDIIKYRRLNGIEYIGEVTCSNSEYITAKVIQGANVGSLQYIMKGNDKIKIEVV